MKAILKSLVIISAIAGLTVGATRAYFSDTEKSAGNTFSAGTLKFNIIDPVATGHQVFNVSKIKPGETVTQYLVVANDGSLDMKWKAWLTETGAGTLDDELKVRWTIHPTTYTGVLTGYTNAGPADSVIMDWTPIANLTGPDNGNMVWASPGAVAFAPNWAAVYKVDVKMDEDADNTYKGATYTGDLNFYATQYEILGW